MARTESPAEPDCWIDLFDADYLMGKMRRVAGPRKLRQLSAKSLIVGPRAIVVLTVRRGNRDHVVKLQPRKVVPKLTDAVRGAKIIAMAVVLKE
jgi:hypothetical protein